MVDLCLLSGRMREVTSQQWPIYITFVYDPSTASSSWLYPPPLTAAKAGSNHRGQVKDPRLLLPKGIGEWINYTYQLYD
jgi:hypothetical protein